MNIHEEKNKSEHSFEEKKLSEQSLIYDSSKFELEMPFRDKMIDVPLLSKKMTDKDKIQAKNEEEKNILEKSSPIVDFKNEEVVEIQQMSKWKNIWKRVLTMSSHSPSRSESKTKKNMEDENFACGHEEIPIRVDPLDFISSFEWGEVKDQNYLETKNVPDTQMNNLFQKKFDWKIKLRSIMYFSVSFGIILLMLIFYFATVQRITDDNFVGDLNSNTVFSISLSYCKVTIQEASNNKVSYKFHNTCWSCSDHFKFQNDLVTISATASADTLQFCKLDLFIPSNIPFSELNVTCSNECYLVINSLNIQPSHTFLNGATVYANIRNIQTNYFSFSSKYGQLLINDIYLNNEANISLNYGDVIFQTSNFDMLVSWNNSRETYCFAGPYTQAQILPNSSSCLSTTNSSNMSHFSINNSINLKSL